MRLMFLLTPLALCAVLLCTPRPASASDAAAVMARPAVTTAGPAASVSDADESDADADESDADAEMDDADAADSETEADESGADAEMEDADAADSEGESDADADAEGEDMPWPDDTELQTVGNEGYSYSITMPGGGEYISVEDLGIDTGDDPMAYPFIWRGDAKSPLFFDLIMLGVVHDATEIDDARFNALVASQHATLLADYPDGTLQAEPITTSDADEYEWTFGMYPASDGSKEIATFSTSDGSDFYTFFFYGRPGWGAGETNWAQMMHIVDSFELK